MKNQEEEIEQEEPTEVDDTDSEGFMFKRSDDVNWW